MPQDGLNKFQELQVENISERVSEKVIDGMKEHFVSKIEYTRTTGNQNTKIYTIYGVLFILGISGFIGIYNLLI